MLNFLLAFITGLAVLNIALYFHQDSLILYPPAKSEFVESVPKQHRITFHINELELSGIYKMDSGYKFNVIYFGGNAEDVNYNYFDFINNLHANFVALNYRGYAGNPGDANLQQMLSDVDAIVSAVLGTFNLESKNIILMGRSLGSAFAIRLSRKYQVAGIIAISPFDSLKELGQKHYPFLPVSLLLKQDLNNLEIAASNSTPLLIITAERDRIIPAIHSRNLFKAWQGDDKRFVSIEDAHHNNIHAFPRYYQEINKFIASLEDE